MQHAQLFTPSPLLNGKSLYLDYESEMLSLLTQDIQPEQHIPLTYFQLRFLAELLMAYPGCCSYAQILAALFDQPFDRCQEQVDHARQAGHLSDLLCETRQGLNQCNQQLAPLGIQVAALFETGYLLISCSPRQDGYTPQRDIHPFLLVRFNWRMGAMLSIPPLLL